MFLRIWQAHCTASAWGVASSINDDSELIQAHCLAGVRAVRRGVPAYNLLLLWQHKA